MLVYSKKELSCDHLVCCTVVGSTCSTVYIPSSGALCQFDNWSCYRSPLSIQQGNCSVQKWKRCQTRQSANLHCKLSESGYLEFCRDLAPGMFVGRTFSAVVLWVLLELLSTIMSWFKIFPCSMSSWLIICISVMSNVSSASLQTSHVAAQYGHTALLYHLVTKWGAAVDPTDNDGRSPLHW